MTPTPPSTTSSSAGGHSPNPDFRVVRKRNRVPLSCSHCRHRKLKCNRSHPCDNCVRRGDASSCSYAAPSTRKKNQSQGSTSPDDMQNRIDRLEGLVLSLMTNGAQSAGPSAAVAAVSRSQSASGPSGSPLEDDDMIREEDEEEDSDLEGVTNSFGVLKVDADQQKSMYVGDSHWHLVLSDIAEVKNYFVQHKKDFEKNYNQVKDGQPRTAIDGPAFLFGVHSTITDSELRAKLPLKPAVDKLVTRYFNSSDPGIHMIHSPTFHQKLREHWQDPSKTSLVWLSLLYAIMCLAMQSYNQIGDEPLEWKGRTLELASDYRMLTVQCLVNSDYTKSSIYTIEALVLYINSEYSSRWDAEVGIWVIISMIVRLAMRMGYHRDPKNFQGISPYQAEMRRRVWAFVRQMDTMFSFQLALPSMIRSSDSDTDLPRNIFEDEFGPESKVLPPERPRTEPTPVSYMIAKSEISFEFGAILEEINGVNISINYDDILKRDSRMREIRDNLAPHLRLRPMDECTHDPATLLMQRFNLDVLWQKTMCVLHRKYIPRSRHNSRYLYSRRVSVESAMQILRHQATLHRESQAGGRMRTMKWFISSLTKHDYILADMIVCLDLHYDYTAENTPGETETALWTPEQRADMISAIETSKLIWTESQDNSVEAFKAANILSLMLEKITAPPVPQAALAEGQTTAEVFAQIDERNRPNEEQSAAMTLGMLSGGLSPNPAAFYNTQSPGKFYNMDMVMGESSGGTGMTPNFNMDANSFGNMTGVASPFTLFGASGGAGGGGMMDMPAGLDWEAWDSFVQNSNPVDGLFQFYPSDDGLKLEGQGQGSQQPQQPQPPQQQGPLNPNDQSMYGNSVFMGANTPGR